MTKTLKQCTSPWRAGTHPDLDIPGVLIAVMTGCPQSRSGGELAEPSREIHLVQNWRRR
jgi:hypothetical protein